MSTLKKILSVLSLIRIYNLWQLAFSLFLSALFLFNADQSVFETLSNSELYFIVLASLLTVAAGYLINNFYDFDRDRIIKPYQHKAQMRISRNTILYLYLFLNCSALVMAYLASWRVLIYFVLYQFMIWFYSHKLNKILVVNNIAVTLLIIAPFLALVIFYQSWSLLIISFALLFFLELFILDIIKDFISFEADRLLGYDSVITVFGRKRAKAYAYFWEFLTLLVIGIIWFQNPGKILKVYLIINTMVVVLSVALLIQAKSKSMFYLLKFLHRLLLFLGIAFIAWSRLTEKGIF